MLINIQNRRRFPELPRNFMYVPLTKSSLSLQSYSALRFHELELLPPNHTSLESLFVTFCRPVTSSWDLNFGHYCWIWESLAASVLRSAQFSCGARHWDRHLTSAKRLLKEVLRSYSSTGFLPTKSPGPHAKPQLWRIFRLEGL